MVWHSQHTKFGGKVVADWDALGALFVPQNPVVSSLNRVRTV